MKDTLNKYYFFVVLFILSIAIFSDLASGQDKPAAAKPEPKVQRIAGLNAKFIVALIDDGQGGAWIGTEDEGVFHCDVDNKISQFTTKNGLGDNNGYALAIDKLGRLWVGHLNTGVSVFNGKDWKNYDVVDGPIGERIFDIKICPKDSDVWIATSAGISRYKIDSDNWEHFTREDGLLEDQASALAFKNDGTLIVGTQCHGLAIFNRTFKGDYKHSKNIVAPDRFGQGNISPVPLVPRGIGLPSNLINDILVSKNLETETIWVATNAGLVKVSNDFKKIEYWRGKDYVDKVKGLYGGTPKDWKPVPNEVINQLLPEDYLTCLAEDDQGVIWMGTRQSGFKIADPQTGKQTSGDPKKMGLPDNFITKILMFSEGDYWVGFYSGGIIKPIRPYKLVDRKPIKTRFNKQKIFSVAQNDFPKLPSPIKPPTSDELKTVYLKLKRFQTSSKKTKIFVLNDDWRTRGDWIDTYGRYSVCLCGQGGGGLDLYDGYSISRSMFGGFIGRNFKEKNDALRHWVHWEESNDKRVLQCSQLGGRTQSEWDDHGENYHYSLDGPHVYGAIKLEPGNYFLSLYFFNKDGHTDKNRLRDYTITVKTLPIPKEKFDKLKYPNINAEVEFINAKGDVSSRICNFWGGVYKRFYVEVPKNECIVFKIDRSYSFNTILSGIFVDTVKEMRIRDWENPFKPPHKLTPNWEEVMDDPTNPQLWWAFHALDQLLYNRDKNPIWYRQHGRKYVLPLLRTFVIIKNGKPIAPKGINPTDKERIRNGLAKLANDTQLFKISDQIDFSKEKFTLSRWTGRSELDRYNGRRLGWSWEYFDKFTQKHIDLQSW